VTARGSQPTILTARLRLRSLAAADAPSIQRLAGDFGVADTTLSIPHPYEDGMAEAWIASLGDEPEASRQAVFAVTDGATAAFYGAVGLIIEWPHMRAEMGYWIGQPYWGRGYATEAARAVLEYGFHGLGLQRIHACHFTRNPASGKVLVKIGMRHEGVARRHLLRWDRFEDVALYGILREEFENP